jgi:hypothetical protein
MPLWVGASGLAAAWTNECASPSPGASHETHNQERQRGQERQHGKSHSESGQEQVKLFLRGHPANMRPELARCQRVGTSPIGPGAFSLVPPEVLEPIRRQLRVSDRVLDFAMAQVGLQRARIVPLVGQGEAAGVPQCAGEP